MPDLREQLEPCFQGRVCLMGVGNPDYGDDGLGVHLANELTAAGVPDVVAAGNTPERYLGWVVGERFDHLLFLDAVDFGAEPGSVVFLNGDEIVARFPQISTHKISLGLLSQWAQARSVTRAWLLGVQPASLQPAAPLSDTVQTTLRLLRELLVTLSRGSAPPAGGYGRGYEVA